MVAGGSSHLALLFAPKSSQKYRPVAGQVQARLAGTLLDELEEDSGVELILLAATEDAGALLAGALLAGVLEATGAIELAGVEDAAPEDLLSEPPQALNKPAVKRLSSRDGLFIFDPSYLSDYCFYEKNKPANHRFIFYCLGSFSQP